MQSTDNRVSKLGSANIKTGRRGWRWPRSAVLFWDLKFACDVTWKWTYIFIFVHFSRLLLNMLKNRSGPSNCTLCIDLHPHAISKMWTQLIRLSPCLTMQEITGSIQNTITFKYIFEIPFGIQFILVCFLKNLVVHISTPSRPPNLNWVQ